jgi:hypothetical protein
LQVEEHSEGDAEDGEFQNDAKDGDRDPTFVLMAVYLVIFE